MSPTRAWNLYHSYPTSANFGKSTHKVSHVMSPGIYDCTIRHSKHFAILEYPSNTVTVHVMIHAIQSTIGGSALSTHDPLYDFRRWISRSHTLAFSLNQDRRYSGSYASIVGPAPQMSSRSKPCRMSSTLFGSPCLMCNMLKDVPPRLRLPHTLRARIDYYCCSAMLLTYYTHSTARTSPRDPR